MGKTLTRAIDVVRQTTGQLRAVRYLRVSTTEQRKGYGISYTGKRTAAHIEKKGWQLVDTYVDEGVSGSLEAFKRDELSRLMRDANKVPRPFDVVVVNEERAIGRRDRAFWPWVWELEDLGVFVAIVKGDYDNTTPDGRSRMRKKAAEAEDERELIRERTQGGIQEKAEDGGYAGGYVPYGYRIENQGKRGESRLVLDECPAPGICDARHELALLRRGRSLFVEHKNWRTATQLVNSEGYLNRSGKPWKEANLKARITSHTTLKAEQVWRNPDHAQTVLDAEGSPVYGETVIIKLDPVFTPEEVKELEQAMEAAPKRAAPRSGRVYPLSARMVGRCGAVYTGLGRSATQGWQYRCKGKTEAYPGARVCSCSLVDAVAAETYVWGEVRKFLGDAARLQVLTETWTGGQGIDYAVRIADLDQQIDTQSAIIAVTMGTAARQAVARGLSQQAAEKAVDAALKPLNEELSDLEKARSQAAAWQRESESANQRAVHLQELARTAHSRLDALDLAEQAEFLNLLDIKATIVGDVPQGRQGSPCTLVKWFRERARAVPALTDEAWARVEPLLDVTYRTQDPRQIMAALLHKARTGCRWPELPAEYGHHGAVQTQWTRWRASGLWDRMMDSLADLPGVPPWQPELTPPMTLTGELIPELLLDSEEHLATQAPSASVPPSSS
ncbi:recombinase family protein [Streptomyces sp. NPDC087851]|uniref:recombinase family protein n=1 Tax=Streptomyces sp. NPDC087851 TaxID=3365810 RepID=UPI0037FF86E8